VDRFEDYRSHDDIAQPHVINSRPWWPFQSRTDFELAELALEAALTKKQIDKLIKCVTRCVQGQDTFNITSTNDLHTTWEAASQLHTPVPNLA
jgi:hypothetical protein